MTLTEFVQARIAEDEGAVDGAYQGEELGYRLTDIEADLLNRLDRSVDARRAVVEDCAQCLDDDDQFDPQKLMAEAILRYLAAPYADHPDYQQEWKP